MKTLTIWEPWASLIMMGLKRYETRGWATHYRGPLAIHAAKRWTKFQREFTEELIDRGFSVLDNGWEPQLGKILGRVTLASVSPVNNLRRLSRKELLLGNFSPGCYGWMLENPIRLPTPILHQGRQGLWTWIP